MRLPLLVFAGALSIAAAPPETVKSKDAGQTAPAAPRTPADVVAGSVAADWVDIVPSDLMIFNFAGGREVVVQLATEFAPDHIANIKAIARAGHWAKATIYRVADNWVTQWGAGEDEQERSPPLPKGVKEQPEAEYTRPAKGLSLLPSGSVDPYSQMSAFAGGWPVAMHADGRVNLAFCYATVGVARGGPPDTGSGSELFAIIGTPSRRLDRNFAAIGRVVSGIEHLSALPRGSAPLGFYAPDQQKIPMTSVRIASDLPAAQRPSYQVMKQTSAAFAEYLELASHRRDYGVGSPGAALCAIPVPVRKKS